MPPGNLTNMTDEERALLGQWLDAGLQNNLFKTFRYTEQIFYSTFRASPKVRISNHGFKNVPVLKPSFATRAT